ncbi:MAG: hypothetical protein KKF41_14825 [Actinobacteria bacterium]|nr:hypothetical protein [Actinomycetota bacterium]MBU1944759.1 hypothetical protein [Actinomycetota bacterium]MBU2688850.1 hypothetical protein [Actinomycetota bacterium]
MRRCPDCGFPRRFARFMEWHSDGTIVGSVKPKIPVMFLEVSEWDSIYDTLADAIGAPIEHIVIEAQKYIGKDLYAMVRALYWNIDARRVPNNRFLRPQWLARLIVAGMGNDLAGLGAGRVRVESYAAGDHLSLRFSDPCMIPMVVGNCLGIYESVEQMDGSNATHRLEDGELVVCMTHAEGKPESEERLYLEEVEGGTGPLSFQRCGRCGVPVPMCRSVAWDLSKGIIRNPRTWEREEMVAVQSINSILRELERELGEDVIRIVYDAQKAYSRRRLEGSGKDDPAGFWEEYLTGMALRGLGYPVRFETSPSSVTVEIHNAYNQDLYAAKVAAGLEAVTGSVADIEWQTRDRRCDVYTVTAGRG